MNYSPRVTEFRPQAHIMQFRITCNSAPVTPLVTTFICTYLHLHTYTHRRNSFKSGDTGILGGVILSCKGLFVYIFVFCIFDHWQLNVCNNPYSQVAENHTRDTKSYCPPPSEAAASWGNLHWWAQRWRCDWLFWNKNRILKPVKATDKTSRKYGWLEEGDSLKARKVGSKNFLK